jgi:RHS repeat-associated protein
MNVASGTRATLIPDVQGSFIGALDAGSGALTKYGDQTYGESGTTGGSFRYTGQRIDPETNGLYYYRARMYAPAWGRFMQADPIGYAGGANFYRYVRNDPLNLNDPYGFAPDSPQPQAGGAGGNGAQPPDVAAAAAADEPDINNGNLIQVAQNGPTPGLSPEDQEFQTLENETLGAGGAVTLPGGETVLNPPPPLLGSGVGPNFVVSPGGTVFPVPQGATGPVPVYNPAGSQTGVAFTGGAGGVNDQVSTMRIMNQPITGPYQSLYPNGYITYQNNASPTPQTVNPYTGQTVPPSLGHFPIQ